jgi:Zn-finger nucleic acid-binding protein
MRKYIIDNIELDPIRMGELGDFDYGCEPNATCHDCGCGVGELHHLNCDAQRCPACGGQFISCGCNIKVLDDEENTKNFDKSIYYKILGKDYKFKEEEEM